MEVEYCEIPEEGGSGVFGVDKLIGKSKLLNFDRLSLISSSCRVEVDLFRHFMNLFIKGMMCAGQYDFISDEEPCACRRGISPKPTLHIPD